MSSFLARGHAFQLYVLVMPGCTYCHSLKAALKAARATVQVLQSRPERSGYVYTNEAGGVVDVPKAVKDVFDRAKAVPVMVKLDVGQGKLVGLLHGTVADAANPTFQRFLALD